jgi:hypothetical protein
VTQKKYFLIMTAFSARSVLVLPEHIDVGFSDWAHVLNVITEFDVRFSQL